MRDAVVTTAGSRIRWVEIPGAEPTRVYVHGLGASSPVYYAAVTHHPALAGRRSLLIDLLGFGISDRPADFGHTLPEHADALAAALDAAGVRDAEVIGHSMGGAVAILLADRRPDLVARLVVAEAPLDAKPTENPPAGSVFAHTPETFLARGFAETLERVGPFWAATMRLADPLAVLGSAVGLARNTTPTVRETLAKLTLPRTFLAGDRGEELRDADGLRAAGVRVVTIADSGHNVMIDNPDAFARAVAGAA
ncbi:alpha/beta fold hydrolase [Catellatospora chokoriensis]|uniref:Alpha/beta hydrolase n=1 Tax=Catellatospora chokoriensis TaxID=310353 RepID=A0A8J3K0N9_9ACTN|nr:alpha/beta hydrolase [Catellatospora chokoriensis]GIF94551.1 alpha/beta hydrolase [Catellatospora chokoriensis]